MDLSSFIVEENTSVYDAADIINKNGKQIVFVCNSNKLVAVLSDGDIRRYILKNGDFFAHVKDAANYKPVYVPISRWHEAKALMKNSMIRAIPIVNSRNEIVSIEFFDNTRVTKKMEQNIPVVIMAGGRGTRLAPYTDFLPKPLIPIGEKTITEHIICRFMEFGCRDFFIIVNYKKELIKAYFSELTLPCNIEFVDETEYLGTGGGLKLLENKIFGTFFMTNCDILIEADYNEILSNHIKNKNVATMVCAMKKVIVPYGTIQLDSNGKPQKIIEKPEYSLLTNTGLYILEHNFLDGIQHGRFVHITELIQAQIDSNAVIGTYEVNEDAWLDMGQMNELERMKGRIG